MEAKSLLYFHGIPMMTKDIHQDISNDMKLFKKKFTKSGIKKQEKQVQMVPVKTKEVKEMKEKK
jgi:hypothetical protein